MITHVQHHPIQCVAGSFAGLGVMALKFFHLASGFLGEVAQFGGGIITIVTIIGMVRTWLRNRKAQ